MRKMKIILTIYFKKEEKKIISIIMKRQMKMKMIINIIPTFLKMRKERKKYMKKLGKRKQII